MALGSNSNNTLYFNAVKGKLRRKAKDNDPPEDVKEFTKDDGTKVKQVELDWASGFVKAINIKVGDFRGKKMKSLEIVLTDGDDTYNIQANWNGSAAKYFLGRAENIDFTRELKVEVFAYRPKDSEYESTYLSPVQNGEKTVPVYGYEAGQASKVWPKPVEKEVNGEMVWDKGEVLKEMEAIVDRVKIKLEREVKQAVKLPPSEGGRYDAPVAHKQAEGKYNPAGDDFDKPSAVANAVDAGGDDFRDDLPWEE